MADDLLDPSVDIDRMTGGNIVGWPQVVQSLDVIFTTRFGERVLREYFGSAVPRILGELGNAPNVVRFFAAIGSAIDQWEPRFRLTRIVPTRVGRDGRFFFDIEGEFRPRALLGDFTPEGARRVSVVGSSSGIEIER